MAKWTCRSSCAARACATATRRPATGGAIHTAESAPLRALSATRFDGACPWSHVPGRRFKKTSSTKKDDDHPTWNEVLHLGCVSPSDATIAVHCFDKDSYDSDDSLLDEHLYGGTYANGEQIRLGGSSWVEVAPRWPSPPPTAPPGVRRRASFFRPNRARKSLNIDPVVMRPPTGVFISSESRPKVAEHRSCRHA